MNGGTSIGAGTRSGMRGKPYRTEAIADSSYTKACAATVFTRIAAHGVERYVISPKPTRFFVRVFDLVMVVTQVIMAWGEGKTLVRPTVF